MAKTIIITFCLSTNLYFYQIFFLTSTPPFTWVQNVNTFVPPPKLHSGLLLEELSEKWSCQASSNSQHEWTSEQPDFSRWRGGDATRGPAGRSQSAGGLCEPLGSLAFQSCGTIPSQSHRLKMELGGFGTSHPNVNTSDMWRLSHFPLGSNEVFWGSTLMCAGRWWYSSLH